MKKIISIITAGIIIVMSSISVMADNTEYIDYCKENLTFVDIEGDAVTLTDAEKLWDDRTVISGEELTEVQNYNNENEDKKDYSIKVKVLHQSVGFSTLAYDPSTGKEDHNIYPDDNVKNDAGFSKMFYDNIDAFFNLEKTDNVWCFVSIEKHLIENDNDQVISYACDSHENYTLTLDIPSYYKGSEDLKLIKLVNGQATYFENIDSAAETCTVTSNGSAIYIFSGTRVKSDSDSDGAIEPVIGVNTNKETDSQQNQSINETPEQSISVDNSGCATAPKTADTNSIIAPVILLFMSTMVLFVLHKKQTA